MTYLVGNLIQAVDYNGFVSSNANNINQVWSTGSGDSGWGQTAVSNVAVSATVTATQWATLVNRLSSMGSQTGTTITARTAPVTGNTIAILANVATDINNITSNRLNAPLSGSEIRNMAGTISKTTATSGATWTITFGTTINWDSANQARYFFNAGGRIRVQFFKSSTGQTGDPEWNDLANNLSGQIFITAGTATQTIAGTSYTGTTKSGGTGSPAILSTNTGFYDLTTSDTILYKQFADTAPYTNNFIQLSARVNATPNPTSMILTTVWSASDGDPISGGTATSSSGSFGTAPTTFVSYFPPSTTNLSNTWGSLTVTGTVT
jgi:hypothetical protein